MNYSSRAICNLTLKITTIKDKKIIVLTISSRQCGELKQTTKYGRYTQGTNIPQINIRT